MLMLDSAVDLLRDHQNLYILAVVPSAVKEVENEFQQGFEMMMKMN